MEATTRAAWEDLRSQDGAARYDALNAILAATEQPVSWAYEVWDELVAMLHHENNHQRAIAAQVLCNLAKSDPEQRMLRDIDALMALTRDARFVTARHTLQALWNIGTAGPQQRALLLDRLAGRFADCAAEKNCTLIRFDIVQGMRKLYDAARDEAVRERALALIETEPDAKYRKKYAALWKR